MRSREAREKFKEADRLFREKKFAEALVVLDELDKAFPDVKNVLYPRAMCLARVKRFDEALEICRQLKVEFGDPRGEKLIAKIGEYRKALAKKEEAQKDPVAAGSAIPPPNVFTLDSSPPHVAQNKNLEFSPTFDPAAQPFQAAAASNESLGGAELLDLGDGSPVLDMAALDNMFSVKPKASLIPPVPARPASRKGLYSGIGVGVAVLLTVVVLALWLAGKRPAADAPAPPQAESSSGDQAVAPEDAPPIHWHETLEAASEAAEEGGQDVLLYFYSAQNDPDDTKQMDDYFWSDPYVRDLARNWVCARIDADKYAEVASDWEVETLPTTIITDRFFEDGYYRHEGLLTAQDFHQQLAAADMLPAPGETTLPALPVAALVLLPIVYVAATSMPVFFTLLIMGRMPEDEFVAGILGMILVGIFGPIAGWRLIPAVYNLGALEVIVYYGLLIAHLFAANWIMTVVCGLDMPFYVYLFAYLNGLA